MTDLVNAYQRDDIHRYESILQGNKDVLADPFIAENIDEVTRNMRTKAVIKLIAPYTLFTLAFVAKQLRISVPEVQDILGFLIVDQKIRGQINQANGTVEVEGKRDVGRMESMRAWGSAIESLSTTIFNDGEGFRQDEAGFQSMQSSESLMASNRSTIGSGLRGVFSAGGSGGGGSGGVAMEKGTVKGPGRGTTAGAR